MILSFPARLRTLALERPDAPAITCAGETVTRAELESRGTRLARELQSYGVGVGDFVTIAIPNSVDWFVAYLAAWKLGAIPQPVSAKLPGRELGAIVDALSIHGSGAAGTVATLTASLLSRSVTQTVA